MGKKMTAAAAKVEPRLYGLKEAVGVVKQSAFAKFDESVDLALRLGVDPKRSDQMVRGTSVLPHGTGKKVRVLVFAKGEKEQEARAAGADFVGSDDLMEKIKGGWMDFDQAISTPDLMGSVGKVSFDEQRLYENAQTILEAVMKAKPASCKGHYLKSATISSTMGPGVKLDVAAISKQWS